MLQKGDLLSKLAINYPGVCKFKKKKQVGMEEEQHPRMRDSQSGAKMSSFYFCKTADFHLLRSVKN